MKTILKYSAYASLLMAILFGLDNVIFSDTNYSGREVYGYLSILIALSFIFFGVKAYRNIECEGSISFFKALFVGLLISVLPAILFGIYNVIYMEYIDPGFAESYYQSTIDQMKIDYSGEELGNKLAEMESSKELFMSPMFNFFLMTLTVFLVGVLVTVISAVSLRKS